MEYKVVAGNGWTPDSAIKELEKKVNDSIQQGWEPIGGVIIASFNENAYQAMIRRSAE